MRPYVLAILFLAGSLTTKAVAEDALPPGFDPQRHMRVSEVRDGMTGYGLSVFHGTKIERFDVEVISVLKNFNAKSDVVLVRCKGANLEHTGSIAGMSGSPIFLRDDQGRDRMIGAFAYGWPLVKDPIGGVQPIEYMLAMPTAPRKEPAKAGPASSGDIVTGPVDWSVLKDMVIPVSKDQASPGRLKEQVEGPATSQMRPLSLPIMLSGVSPKVMAQMRPWFAACGAIPVQAGGAGVDEKRAGPPAKLEPGAVIAVPLMTGDAEMTAVGTVTEVLGDRVLAFGHPFFNEGDACLPMASGYIHSVIPNHMNSFKIGSPTAIRGTIHCDQSVGISGCIGQGPPMIPIDIRCIYTDGSFDQTYHFRISQHPKLTPTAASAAAAAAISGTRDLPQYHTLDYNLTLDFANGQTLHVVNRSVNSSTQDVFTAITQSVMAALENPFDRVYLKHLSGTIRVSREAKQAEILSVSIPRAKYRPGETVKAFVSYRAFRGAEAMLPVTFELPRDLAEATYDLAVLDSEQHLADEQSSRPFRFNSENAGEVFAVLRDLASIRRDALYLRLLRQSDGVAIGRVAMPHLPASRRKVLTGAGLSNTTTFVSSAVKAVPTEYVMNGQAHFQITIDKDAKVETPLKPRPDGAAPAPVRPDDGRGKSTAKISTGDAQN